jgi:ABC-type lipoprotein release transport system permease subunit
MRGTNLADRQDESAPTAEDEGAVSDVALWHSGGHLSALPLHSLARARIGSFLLAVTLGTLVTVMLLCIVPLYSALVSDVELQYVLTSNPVQAVNVETTTTLASVLPNDADDVERATGTPGVQHLLTLAPTAVTYLSGSHMVFTAVDGIPVLHGPEQPYSDYADARAQPYAFDYRQAAPHMRLYDGRLPRAVPAGQPLEVLATPALGLHVGDVLGLAQFEVPKATTQVRIVGIWFPLNPSDPFWNAHPYDTPNGCLQECPPPVYPLLFTRGGFFNAISTFNARGNLTSQNVFAVSVHHLYLTQRLLLTSQNVADAVTQLRAYRTDLQSALGGVEIPFKLTLTTRLDTILAALQGQLQVLAQPLYMVAAQLGGLALLFMVVVAMLLIEARAATIATLRSRGASRLQLTVTYMLLAAGPMVLAGVAGLLLAAQLAVAFILRVGTPPGLVSHAYLSHSAAPNSATSPAIAGTLLALAAIVLAAWMATRGNVVSQRAGEGRGQSTPFWKRYNLDLLLALLCLAGYVELSQFGGLSVRAQLSQASTTADPLQVAAPLLLLLAGALLTLRLLPPLAALGSWAAARGRGVTNMLAFTQVARASARFARLTLLLTLVVGVGIFALTFQSSVERNAAERAAYMNGGDVRIQLDQTVQGSQLSDILDQSVGQLPGVLAAAPIVRLGAHTTDDLGNAEISMLGIDPDHFAQVAFWRDDFAAQPLATLLQQMRTHVAGPTAGTADVPIWALVSAGFAGSLHLRAGDQFTILPQWGAQGRMTLRVGAIANAFPTMYAPQGGPGFVVADEADLTAALSNPNIGNVLHSGPTEYWLHTRGLPGEATAREGALVKLQLETLVTSITDRRALTVALKNEPATAGIGGLLLIGTALATLLLLLACFIQAAIAPRHRGTQFAILRTLGMTGRQLLALLLTEQVVTYIFGVVGGVLFGLVLSTATLPFLQFASALDDLSTVGVPPYILSFNFVGMALLIGVLVIGFALSLAFEAAAGIRAGLARALRIGED